MSASTILEIIGLALGGGGAGAVISRGTRLIVAVENLADTIKQARADIAAIVGTVQGLQTRIATIEGQLQGGPGGPAPAAAHTAPG